MTPSAPAREGLRTPRGHVAYQRLESVEDRLRRLLGCRSVGAAHQRLLRIRRENALALEALIGSPRLVWFMEPSEAVLSRQPVCELSGALIAEALRADGEEEGALGDLMNRLGDPHVARLALRDIHREIGVNERLARAICARHGWTA